MNSEKGNGQGRRFSPGKENRVSTKNQKKEGEIHKKKKSDSENQKWGGDIITKRKYHGKK